MENYPRLVIVSSVDKHQVGEQEVQLLILNLTRAHPRSDILEQT